MKSKRTKREEARHQVTVDDTELDILTIKGRKPRITMLIDSYSRAVVGWHIA